jgi:colanic acid/amylovoran biosynthesis glycosyltransferase
MSGSANVLVIVPSCEAYVDAQAGLVTLDRKFHDGVLSYCASWGGPLRLVMQPSPTPEVGFDSVSLAQHELPFELVVAPFSDLDVTRQLAGAAVVLAARFPGMPRLAARSRELGVPLVYVTEYTLLTRLQIAGVEAKGALQRVRRSAWEVVQELAERREIAAAAGLQCNGVPTHDAYRELNTSTLLYFDSRVTDAMLVDEQTLERRLAAMRQGAPLRLAFSGRLTAMKGVQHLPAVAAALHRSGVDFRLTIAGQGDLEPALREAVQASGLRERVQLAGALDFKTELVPWMREHVDLFVCPHVQGDPSCTYLEVMSAGVPVVGFANEALRGVHEHSGTGWVEPLGAADAVAARVAQLSQSRDELADHSRRALAFAGKHTFEATFRARVEHLRSCALEASRRSPRERPAESASVQAG